MLLRHLVHIIPRSRISIYFSDGGMVIITIWEELQIEVYGQKIDKRIKRFTIFHKFRHIHDNFVSVFALGQQLL